MICMYSQKQGFLHYAPDFISPDFRLDDFPREIVKSPLDRLADRIEACPTLPWGNIHCKTEGCDAVLTEKPFKLSCLSNFCLDKECVENRKKIRLMKLKDYCIRSKKLYHFNMGFKDIPIAELDKKTRLLYHRAFKKFMKILKKLYPALYYLSVRDCNRPEGREDNIRLHYHVATLPHKDYRLFVSCVKTAMSQIQAETGLQCNYSLKGYQSTNAILNYFSKRSIGLFGHEKDNSLFGFRDMMNLEQYFKVFYKTKTFNSNFSFRRHQTAELVAMLNNVPQICPKCHCPTHHNTYFKECQSPLLATSTLPPGISIIPEEKLQIEVIRII